MRRWGWVGAAALAGALLLPASAQPPEGYKLAPRVEARLKAFLAKKYCEEEFADSGSSYSAAQVRLGPDNKPLVLVYVLSRGWCGSGGCHLSLYEDTGQSFRQVVDGFTVSKPVIALLQTRTNGWRDLSIGVHEGADGVFPGRLSYSGGSYNSMDEKEYEANKHKGLPSGAVILFDDYGDKPLCGSAVS